MTDHRAHLGTRRSWVKLWTQQTLYGTTSQELEPAERWVWCGLLCLAGDSPCAGIICVAAGVPYTDQQLARILQVDLDLLNSAFAKMREHGKITVNGEGIHICNWEHYQADYARMQRMRAKRSVTNVTREVGVTGGRNASDAPMESRGRVEEE